VQLKTIDNILAKFLNLPPDNTGQNYQPLTLIKITKELTVSTSKLDVCVNMIKRLLHIETCLKNNQN